MNVFSFSKIDACQSKNLTDTGVNIKNNEVRGGGEDTRDAGLASGVLMSER